MKIIACPGCHTQYDVTRYEGDSLECPCGSLVPREILTSRPAEIHRCGSCGAGVTPQDSTCSYCSSKIERESTTFTLICPECYARNPELSAFCTDCGVRFEPQEPPVEENLHHCPVCENETMEPRVISRLTLQECPGCRGLWVPEDRLDRLVEQAVQAAGRRGGGPVAQKPARSMGPVAYRKCPVCSDSMQRKNFARKSGVIVDWCGHHGTWLDADELEAIAAFVMTQGASLGCTPDDWKMNNTDKRFRAIAAQHMPHFSSPQSSKESVFHLGHVVGGDDVVEGFVDWISDLLRDN